MLVLVTGATLIQDEKRYRHIMQIQQLPHPLNYSKPGKACIGLRKALQQSTLSALDRCANSKPGLTNLKACKLESRCFPLNHGE
jgi:hypothetical protein